MLTKGKQPVIPNIAFAAAICVALASFFIVGCEEEPAASDTSTTTTTTSAPAAEEPEPGILLQADPNPVPGGTDVGKTTITWRTGSHSEADIFMVVGGNETLIATGAKGSKEVEVRPGNTEFRFYNKGERKLVSEVLVNMPEPGEADSGKTSPAGTP